mmetsp:Transcript_17531/g.23621  ORF Transcript_17531/g.23621 Transcript_17531/m.23621 type:complete len:105 (-) Transcript_17531:102-416(-)
MEQAGFGPNGQLHCRRLYAPVATKTLLQAMRGQPSTQAGIRHLFHEVSYCAWARRVRHSAQALHATNSTPTVRAAVRESSAMKEVQCVPATLSVWYTPAEPREV